MMGGRRGRERRRSRWRMRTMRRRRKRSIRVALTLSLRMKSRRGLGRRERSAIRMPLIERSRQRSRSRRNLSPQRGPDADGLLVLQPRLGALEHAVGVLHQLEGAPCQRVIAAVRMERQDQVPEGSPQPVRVDVPRHPQHLKVRPRPADPLQQHHHRRLGGWGLHTHFPEDKRGKRSVKKVVLSLRIQAHKKAPRKAERNEGEKRNKRGSFFFRRMIFFAPDFLENRLDFPLMIIKKYSRSQPEFKRTDSEALLKS